MLPDVAGAMHQMLRRAKEPYSQLSGASVDQSRLIGVCAPRLVSQVRKRKAGIPLTRVSMKSDFLTTGSPW
jgi:hypothetical protein